MPPPPPLASVVPSGVDRALSGSAYNGSAPCGEIPIGIEGAFLAGEKMESSAVRLSSALPAEIGDDVIAEGRNIEDRPVPEKPEQSASCAAAAADILDCTR